VTAILVFGLNAHAGHLDLTGAVVERTAMPMLG
jgi:hypothetical protein